MYEYLVENLISYSQVDGNLRRTADRGLVSELYRRQMNALALKYFGVDSNGNYTENKEDIVAYRCPYSGEIISDLSTAHLEHILPVSSNGGTVLFNCIPILDKVNLSNVSNYAEKLQNELNNNRLELNSISIEEKNIVPKLENMISLKEEYDNLKERLDDLEYENNLINKTKEYLMSAYEKMKNSITPKFTKNLSNTVEKISNGKYNKVSINDEQGLIVENQYGDYISAERLSTGTVDQLYLSLRLSMIDEISDESMPIILDEAFAYYDETRLENILKFLSDEIGNHQLIIFTCTNREKNILDKIDVSYNLVEL